MSWQSYPQITHSLCDTPMNEPMDCATLDRRLRSASSQRAATRYRSQRCGNRLGKRIAVIAALAVCNLLNTDTSRAEIHWTNHSMNLKLYAHNLINDWDEFICFVELIHRESSWNYKARNGSHTGLGQMRSEWYGKQTPRKQIRLTLDYITKRYEGRICDGALAHSYRRGWY